MTTSASSLKKVKICGLTDNQAVEAAVHGRAAFLGFVCVEQSKRYILPQKASKLSHLLSYDQASVALFANATYYDIDNVFQSFVPDIIQLHGDETPDFVQKVKEEFMRPVIKAVPVQNAQDIEVAASFHKIADMMLFDAKPPAGAVVTGGHGQSYDWSILSSFQTHNIPYFVAGGITIHNALKAKEVSGANYIDLSSGVEIRPGQKDPKLIADLLSLF
ncbi:MAG: phosphoribosylanthranilate isomerase [Pseudomonadota bacterium]